MGNSHSHQKTIQKNWNTRSKKRTPNTERKHAKKLFNLYDVEKKGNLDQKQAITYINDLLDVTGYRNKILAEEAQKRGGKCGDMISMHFNTELISEIFKCMDKNNSGTIEFDEFIKPDSTFENLICRIIDDKLYKNKLHDSDHIPTSTHSLSIDEKRTIDTRAHEPGDDPENDSQNQETDPEADQDGDDDDDDVIDGHIPLADFDEEEKHFEIMTRKELEIMLDHITEELCLQLGLPKGDTALLLQTFDWKVEKLNALYFDKPKEFLEKAGVVQEPPSKPNMSPDEEVDCLICFNPVPLNETYELSCGHRFFCRECWGAYLTDRIQTNNMVGVLNTTCMHRGCKVKLNKDDWKNAASEDLYKRYLYLLLKSFVESDSHFMFCPSCEKVAHHLQDGLRMKQVTCSCNMRYCFACGLESHNPVSCQQLVKWHEINQNDQESSKLMLATTKKCPHCGTPTERNEGCNHMTCRKEVGGCGGEWCWMCRRDWKTHGSHTGGFYSCNKYLKSTAKKLDDQAALVRAKAERFQHFFDRYFGHEMNKRDATKLREAIQQKTFLYCDHTGYQPKFLMDALELLIQCRHTLKYTYVYGYFLDQNNHSHLALFEYQQANLEGITERLAETLLAPIDKIDVSNLKNLIRVTTQYMKNLVHSLESPDK